nr:HDOD domain-containing protein [Parazoarcus communis]
MSNLVTETPVVGPQAFSSSVVGEQVTISLREIGIPPRPSVLQEIDRERAKPEPDFKRLTDLISSDVALAAAVIKTANAPAFGLSRKVGVISEAVVLLGLSPVMQTVAGIVLQRVFRYSPGMERFWDSSAAVARVSSWLVQRLDLQRRVRPGDIYTFGLFRDCGIPLLMGPFAEYRAVLAEANAARDRAFTEVEDAVLGMNHAVMGARLAVEWGLPDEMVQAIELHHDVGCLSDKIKGLTPRGRLMVALAQLAEYLVQTQTGQGQTCEWLKLGSACLDVLDLAPDRLPSLGLECSELLSAAS